ncbi:S-layer homology domain-containing protein [Alkaliphilus hydrothermalis]|uniref:SLH domain-containing protein n=1 Tax=Alkaliphilus hydrothermalis TaxID=1482730 RepID=A0ABS2NQ10_9FIRM|nr:S-layer homology domain-containing protein [Alkaliphilus hydrothermalis]MBM7615035.1 hypothetical protein [Alkaliphilus hydrothermalis]
MNNLRRKSIRSTVTFIVIIMILSSSVGYAESIFSDVPSNHWAIEYINKMNSEGIITGANGMYSPNLSVSVSQAIVMVTRLMEPSEEELSTAVDTYGQLLSEVGVEFWANEQMAYGLFRGIITEKELRSSYVNGKSRYANKLEICRYLTRALDLEETAKSKELIVLSFNDNIMIPDQEKPYVSMMIDIGVINQYGDVLGNFNPQDSLNRATMAKVLSVAYDYRQGNQKDTRISGYIEDIKFGDNQSLMIRDKNNLIKEYLLDDEVNISKEDHEISIIDLKVGGWIDTTLEGNLITNIDYDTKIEPLKEEIEGTITSILIKEKAEINIKDMDGIEKTYNLASEVVIELNQEQKNLVDIRTGYPVKLILQSDEVIRIQAEVVEVEVKANERFKGKVEYVDGEQEAFIIRLEDNQLVRIDTLASTTYINIIDENATNFDAIKNTNKVTIICKHLDGKYFAETIVISE